MKRIRFAFYLSQFAYGEWINISTGDGYDGDVLFRVGGEEILFWSGIKRGRVGFDIYHLPLVGWYSDTHEKHDKGFRGVLRLYKNA